MHLRHLYGCNELFIPSAGNLLAGHGPFNFWSVLLTTAVPPQPLSMLQPLGQQLLKISKYVVATQNMLMSQATSVEKTLQRLAVLAYNILQQMSSNLQVRGMGQGWPETSLNMKPLHALPENVYCVLWVDW